MAHASNVRVQVFERALGMAGAHGHGRRDLFVHDDIDLHALLCLTFQDAVETPLLIVRRGATKVQLGREPPVL